MKTLKSHCLPSREGEDTLENIEVNPLKVKRLMKELDWQEAQGPDGISPFVFRVR